MTHAMGDFKRLVESNRATRRFVDKTPLIREIIGNEDPILITRPRRWSKTLNLKLLKNKYHTPLFARAEDSVEEGQLPPV